jgi:hypothetical protein
VPANQPFGRRPSRRNMDQGESSEQISATWRCGGPHLKVESKKHIDAGHSEKSGTVEPSRVGALRPDDVGHRDDTSSPCTSRQRAPSHLLYLFHPECQAEYSADLSSPLDDGPADGNHRNCGSPDFPCCHPKFRSSSSGCLILARIQK